MALVFDSARAHELLVEWKDLGECPKELIVMYYELLDSLMAKSDFINYPEHVKDNMRSEAVYQFLKYSHNYNSAKVKSKNGAFTFLCFSATNSYKKAIKAYYREKNMETMIAETVDADEYYEKYSYNMVNQIDSDADMNEKLDSWSHDELS